MNITDRDHFRSLVRNQTDHLMKCLVSCKCTIPFILMFLIWLSFCIPMGNSAAPALLNAPADLLPDLVEKVGPGVVNISSTKFFRMNDVFRQFFGLPDESQRQSSLGTGFIIDTAGHILTNNHVVENADEIMILFLDKRKILAKIIGRDRTLDLALLQLKGGAANKNLVALPLGDSEKVRIGETVFAIGNPFGLQHTVTAGIISQKNRTIGLGAFDRFLQTDASINFGNSGGPLFNIKGEVIGINTAINPHGQLLGFATPISEAQKHIEEFKRYGRIVRPWLGIRGENITPAMQRHFTLPVEEGIVVTGVVLNGPAQKAKFKAGDILLSFNGNQVKDVYELQREMVKCKPGDDISIQYMTAGDTGELKTKTKKMKLVIAPEQDRLPFGVF